MCSLQVQSVISATCIWYDCWSDWDHIPTLWSMTKTEWSPSSILHNEWWGEAPHRKVSNLTCGRLREIHDWLSLSHTHLQIPLACFLLRSGPKSPRYRSGSAPAWPMEYAKSDAVQFLVQKVATGRHPITWNAHSWEATTVLQVSLWGSPRWQGAKSEALNSSQQPGPNCQPCRQAVL